MLGLEDGEADLVVGLGLRRQLHRQATLRSERSG
jgi:hypothetical protein